MINVGIIGLGFMGSTHAKAFQVLEAAGLPCRLAAVSDRSERRLSGEPWSGGNLDTGAAAERLFDPAQVRACRQPEDLIADPTLDLVSICTPTASHVELAMAALQAGKHVLVEKPVALTSADVRRLAGEARAAGRICMPAMCMRFWPGWAWLREQVASGARGPVKTAVFQRLGSRPTWSAVYADAAQSGGALMDLHVHDADFVRWCFGAPRSVITTGTLDHLATTYRMAPGGPGLLLAEGAWGHAPAFGFRMRYVVNFADSTADWDLARPDPLLLHTTSGTETVRLPAASGYEAQARALVGAILRGDASPVPLDDAVGVTELLEAERRSLEEGREITLAPG